MVSAKKNSWIYGCAAVLCGAFLPARPASAGILLEGGANWNTFTFAPLEEEDTANYYGYGGRAYLGYSLLQVCDLALFAHYVPGKLESAGFINPDATLMVYGAELALRIKQAIYVAVRGGPTTYELKGTAAENQIAGTLSGIGYGASVGGIFAVTKEHFWQISFDFLTANLQSTAADESAGSSATRRLDALAVTATFVYNQKGSSNVGSGVLGNFLSSLAF